ncbi:MAG: serine hydrolase domain-containing protein [Janthinobacterium lividum]
MSKVKTVSQLIVSIMLFLMAFSSSAQNIQQKNDSLVVLIKNYINTKNLDAFYNLTDSELQKYISKRSFSQYLKKEIYPLGQIYKAVPIRNNSLNSEYKFALNKDTLLLTLNLDEEYRIRIFILKKYIPVTPNKNYSVPTSNPLQTDLERRIDAVVRTYIQKPFTVGLSLGIIYGDKNSIYNYGESIKGKNELPNSKCVFDIGPISQTFTATLLAYFVNQGKIKLTDPITKYLPDSVAENTWLKTVSILSLSNYTSGLVSFPYYPDLEKPGSLTANRNLTDDRFFLYLKHSIPRSKPGEAYAYSDIPYNLLALILERASHQSYGNLVKTIICNPLSLNNTAQHFTHKEHKNLKKFYNALGVEIPTGNYGSLENSGWLQSTMSDLLKYAEANMANQQNDELSKAFQLTQQITFSSKNNKLGLGWHVIKLANREYYCSRKLSGGSNSFLAFNAEKKVAVVILSNTQEPVDPIGVNLIKLLQ